MTGSREALGEVVRRRRIEAGLTQEQLAERTGLSVRAISDIERGVVPRPRRASVTQLARALGLEDRGDGAPADAMGAGLGRDGATARPVPRQLPPATRHFVGREAELAAMDALLPNMGGAAVVSAISGPAGVGKTALAVHWAYRVVHRFPDGQLYMNLHGYDPDQPRSATEALAAFLWALGVPGRDIPPETDERTALFRSLLADRRMLIVLDNASEAEQVRPLLPGSSSCMAVVTSRDSLTGLVARDGAVRLKMDGLPQAEAVSLLHALVGSRVQDDRAAAARLAAQCCRLPLALRVAAELAISRPADSLRELAGELADLRCRLDLLDAGGDPLAALRSVFSWSCRHLPADASRVFRLSGLHPGPDWDRFAVAALAGATPVQSARCLASLVRAHLVQPTGAGRYGMHDLLRAYARELCLAHEGEEQQRTALIRLFDYYLHTAAIAMDRLYPAERHERPQVPEPGTAVPSLVSRAAARAWLDAELPSLVAVARHTCADRWPGYATGLDAVLYRYLQDGDHYSEAAVIHAAAYSAACHTGERAAQASALTNLGLIHLRHGHYEHAARCHQRALAVCRETGERGGEARALGSLGLVSFMLGHYRQAAEHYGQTLDLYRQAGDRTGEARTLTNLALAEQRQGHYQQAVAHYQQAIHLFREAGDQVAEAYPLANLGAIYLRQGRYHQAQEHCQRALALHRQSGNRSGEAYALTNSGDLSLCQRRFQQAAAQHRQALTIFSETGDRSGQAQALNGLGEAALATSQPGEACAHHTSALRLATQISDEYEQARAHRGLARTHHASGDLREARHHWQQAFTQYSGLGAPEADEVRAELAGSTRLHDYR